MKLGRFTVQVVFLAVLAVGATGCMPQEVNDLINGGVKLANGQVSDMTASEIMAVANTTIELINSQLPEGETPLPTLTPEQAAALVTFLDANGSPNSPEEVEALIQQAIDDPSSIQGVDELAAAFGGTYDTSNPQAIMDLLNQIFPGGVFTPPT